MTEDSEPLTSGQVADLLGIQTWKIRDLLTRKLIPEPRRIARYRVFNAGDVPSIREAARKAGYLKTEKPELAAC